MDNRFKWDPYSAGRKFLGDNGGAKVNIGVPNVIGVEQRAPSTIFDPKKDSYRNCSRCGKHMNYHKGGQCPH